MNTFTLNILILTQLGTFAKSSFCFSTKQKSTEFLIASVPVWVVTELSLSESQPSGNKYFSAFSLQHFDFFLLFWAHLDSFITLRPFRQSFDFVMQNSLRKLFTRVLSIWIKIEVNFNLYAFYKYQECGKHIVSTMDNAGIKNSLIYFHFI